MLNRNKSSNLSNLSWLALTTIIVFAALTMPARAQGAVIDVTSVSFLQSGVPVDTPNGAPLQEGVDLEVQVNFITNQENVSTDQIKAWFSISAPTVANTNIPLSKPSVLLSLPTSVDPSLNNSFTATVASGLITDNMTWVLNWVDYSANSVASGAHLIAGFESLISLESHVTVLDYFADGPSPSAVGHHFTCPQNSVLSQLDASFDPQVVDSLGFACSPLNADGSTGTPVSQIDLGYASEYGTVRGSSQSLPCSGRMITGIRGRAGQRVDQIGHHCSDLEQMLAGTSETGLGDPFGSTTGGSPVDQRCGAGKVATGAYVWVNSNYGDIGDIKLICTDFNAAMDQDGDGFANNVDNCPGVSNPLQMDSDSNGVGDDCEAGIHRRIILTADSDIQELAVSGQSLVASLSNTNVRQIADVIEGFDIQAGKNVLAIKANIMPGSLEGLLADVIINGRKTGSKAAWKITSTPPVGDWMDVNFDDSSWDYASEYGEEFSDVANMPFDSPAKWIWTGDAVNDTEVYARLQFYDQYFFIQEGGVNSDYMGTGPTSSNEVQSFRCPEGSAMTQTTVYYRSSVDASMVDDINAVSFGCSVLAANGEVEAGFSTQLELGYPEVLGDKSTSQDSAPVSCGQNMITGVRGIRGVAVNDLGYECSDIDQVLAGQHQPGMGDPVGAGRWEQAFEFNEECPLGYVAVGADVTVEDILGTQIINGVSLACSRIVPEADDPTQSGYSLSNAHSVSVGNLMAASPGTYDTKDSMSCPLGEVVVDMNIGYDANQYGGTIKDIEFTCAVLNSDGSVGPLTNPTATVGSPFSFGLPQHNVSCPGGILTGLRGRTDATNIYTMGHFCTNSDPSYGTPIGDASVAAMGTLSQVQCPENHAMTGIDVYTNGDYDYSGIDVQCTEVTPGLPGGPEDPPPSTDVWGLNHEGDTFLGYANSGNEPALSSLSLFECPIGSAVSGFDVLSDHAGVHGVRFACSSLSENGEIGAAVYQTDLGMGYPASFGNLYDTDTNLLCLDGFITGIRALQDVRFFKLGYACSTLAQVRDGGYSTSLMAGIDNGFAYESQCAPGDVVTGALLELNDIGSIKQLKDMKLMCTEVVTNDGSVADSDGDSIPDSVDNCRFTPNPNQDNSDADSLGDKCDGDKDNDGVRDLQDNCPYVPNPSQTDIDDDDVGNECELTTAQDFAVCFLSPDEIGVGENGLCPSDVEGLSRGEQLWSANGKYSVTINKGLSIIEYSSQGQFVRPVTGLRNTSTYRTEKARLTPDGNFELLDRNDNVLSSTGTGGSIANYMYLSEGGDLFIECLDGSVVWSSDSSKIEASSCQNTSVTSVAKSLEMAEKLRVTSELLCSDSNDIVTKCPAGKRYQFLSVDDSYVKLENQEQTEADLMSFLLGVPVDGGSGLRFLIDAWTAQNMSVTKCLDRSSGLNDCFFSEAEIDEDSLFSSDDLPPGIDLSDIKYQLTLGNNDDVDVPNVVVDGLTYVVNQCHRHTTNLYYLDSLTTFNNNKQNKDDFIARYYPKQDCIIDGRNESQIIGAASNYKDLETRYLSATLQAIRFAEEAAILSVPFVLSDGLLGITLAGTELEFLISSARVFGEVAGFTQGVYAVATDFHELSSCQTDVCKTRVTTDIAMNGIMLGQQIYSHQIANGKTVIQAKAADITESMVDLVAEINRPNSMITEVNLPASQLNHYRIMALAARDKNFAVIMEVMNNGSDTRLFDAVTNLKDSEFKKTKFVEKFLTETDAIVEDAENGTLNETRLQEFIDKLNSPCGL